MTALRQAAVAIGVVAAILIFLLVNPWLVIEDDTLRQVISVAFWIAFVVLLIVLFEDRKQPGGAEVEVQGPAFVRYLFHNTRAGLFWLPIRLFLGFSWLEAGWHKITDPAWTQNGEALTSYWERAVAIPEQGRPPISYEWYRSFIEWLLSIDAAPWFSWIIMLGEIAVGLGLLVGALTGIAAFFGATMNMSFLLAGSGSTNPIMFTLAVGVMLAWRVAGWYGLDRYLLPLLGTPWTRTVATEPPRTQPTVT
jgi:thiosulfate dehydrogenase [quinone] large subunit